nr:MAG TPA: hypothetical protein [Caudoviricetes sp.]
MRRVDYIVLGWAMACILTFLTAFLTALFK